MDPGSGLLHGLRGEPLPPPEPDRQHRRRDEGQPRPGAHDLQVPQIENVDVDVNVDVDSHPVGSFTPHNVRIQSSKSLMLLLVSPVYFLSYEFKTWVSI